MQKVLIIAAGDGLRSRAYGWAYEDGDLVKKGVHIDASPTPLTAPSTIDPVKYDTPLHAIGDGWNLLAPPTTSSRVAFYDWWFVRGSM